MRDVQPHDRPREKLARSGAASLGDNELVAVVIGQGGAGHDALAIANAVVVRAGGLQGLTRITPDELRCVTGVGAARAAQVLAAVELGRRTLVRGGRARPLFRTPAEAAGYLLPLFGARPVEQFGVVLLDARHRMVRPAILSTGTLDGTVVSPRAVFREALAADAAAVMVFHNHPSGDPTPSGVDQRLTQQLVVAGEMIGIPVVDHLVLADARYYSFKEAGVIGLRSW